MGLDAADMAYQQETEFEMHHRLRVVFQCSDLSSLKRENISSKIEVSRIVELTGQIELIEATEVIEDTMQPSWDLPLTIDYSLQDTNFYMA